MKARLSRQEIGEKCHRMFTEAEVHRANMSGVIQSLADYARPSLGNINTITGSASESKDTTKHTRLFDTTLMDSVDEHAAGIKSWMSSANSQWFILEPDTMYGDDEEIIRWHHKAGQILEQLQLASNFHNEDHEAIIDGAAIGTRAELITTPVSRDSRSPFFTRRLEPGTFSMLENAEGIVDSIFFRKEYTCRQAVQHFGEENVPAAVLERYKTKPESQEKDLYVLCLYPRADDERDADMIDQENMPYAEVWLHEATKTVVLNSGHFEKPFVCSRHLKWAGTPFGIAPAIKALANARQLNNLQCSLDLLADIAANPRLLIPVEQRGNVNLMPGGPTYYSDPNRLPKMWGNEGSFPEGEARVKMRRADIERQLNLDIFKTFRRITKEITATEAMEIRQESIDLFSPVFSLLSTEHYDPILQRQFSLALRAGLFPPLPEKMQIPISDTEVTIMPPKVRFTSRIAMAITNRHKGAIEESLRRRTEVASILGPAAFDDLKVPDALRMVDRGNGLPADLHRTPEEVAEIQQQRAEAEAQQRQVEMMTQAATAAAKLGVKAPGATAA